MSIWNPLCAISQCFGRAADNAAAKWD